MKKFLVFLSAIFICTFAIAHTIEWYNGDTLLSTTTCSSGDNITPPTAPAKYGYHLKRWVPYGVVLEYIESTGTQWIDTGYIPNDDTRMEISYKVTAVGNLNCGASPIGGRVGYVKKNFGIFSPVNSLTNNMVYYANAMNTFGFESVGKDIIGIIDVPNNYIALKTTDRVYSQSSNIPHVEYEQPLYLFQVNTNGTAGKCVGTHIQIMYVKLSENGVMIRDMIPVLKDSNIPCMYDKVTGQFFCNQGTGDFIAGPAIQQ